MEAFSSCSSKRDHPLTWGMKWHRYRNKLLSNPAFQRWAARNPLTRSIGHRKALALHHLTAGFVYSQTLSAIVNLELLDRLADGPVHTDEIAQGSALSIAAAETLLKAGGSLGLIEAYGNGLW